MQEVVGVLETNAKSKKGNPVDAGLHKVKAWKLDSEVLYRGCIFPKKLAREATCHAFDFGFDFETEKRIKQREAKKILEDKQFKLMQNLALIVSC